MARILCRASVPIAAVYVSEESGTAKETRVRYDDVKQIYRENSKKNSA